MRIGILLWIVICAIQTKKYYYYYYYYYYHYYYYYIDRKSVIRCYINYFAGRRQNIYQFPK